MNEPNKVKIIVATHKKYRMPNDVMYLPLQVGAYGKDSLDSSYARDDDGSNISVKNPYYCELTGLYWAWKNLDADYIGLVHYRRHFSAKRRSRDVFEKVLRREDIEQQLGFIRIFVPKRRKYYIENLYSHYAHTHYAEHLDLTREIIENKYRKYISCYDEVLKRTWAYMFNMMIMDRGLFDAYCDWLFDILENLEACIDKRGLSPYQSRLYGRISEILFNVWMEQQRRDNMLSDRQVMELPFVYMEDINWAKKGYSFLKAKFVHQKYEGSF